MGDFNIDTLKSDTNSDVFLANLVEMGCIPFFSSVTRPSIKSMEGLCIDNMYVRSDLMKINSYTYTKSSSILITFNWTSEKKNTKDKPNLDLKKLTILSQKIDLSNILNIQDPNQATEILINKIQNLIKQASLKQK